MTTKLKNQIKKLDDTLSNEIIKRQNYFCKRSEDWQESDKGEDYDIETEMLVELQTNLSDSICDLGILLTEEQNQNKL